MDNENEYRVQSEKTKVEGITMAEAGEKLLESIPGLVVMDNDFSLKTKEYELGIGGKEPGRMPEESMELLRRLKRLGWQVLVVSNQPKEGHQVARLVKKMKNGDYPIFPDSIEEIIGEENVLGGGKDFVWKKYKDSPEAVNKTTEWILGHATEVLGQVYFVGDREGDIEYGRKVEKRLRENGFGRLVNTWKVKGLELPKTLKPLEKYIP